MPFGKATDSDVFGACGPGCNIKTFTFTDGTLITDETLLVDTLVCSDPAPNGNCGVLAGQSSNVVVGGTGVFAGATGSLLNTFTLTPDSRTGAHSAIAHYSGTVTLEKTSAMDQQMEYTQDTHRLRHRQLVAQGEAACPSPATPIRRIPRALVALLGHARPRDEGPIGRHGPMGPREERREPCDTSDDYLFSRSGECLG